MKVKFRLLLPNTDIVICQLPRTFLSPVFEFERLPRVKLTLPKEAQLLA